MQHSSQGKFGRENLERKQNVVPRKHGRRCIPLDMGLATLSAGLAVVHRNYAKWVHHSICFQIRYNLRPDCPDGTETFQGPRLWTHLESTREPGAEEFTPKPAELDRLTLENAKLTVRITDYKLPLKTLEESVLYQTGSLKALVATIVPAEMENWKLKTDSSSLCKEKAELLNWTKDSGNTHFATRTENLMATIITHLLRISLEVDEKIPQWAGWETSDRQNFTEHIIHDWNGWAEFVQCKRILQHRNDMVVPYTPSALNSLGKYYTPSSRSKELLVVQIVEKQFASEKWRAFYPDDDVKTGAVDVFKRSVLLQVCLKQSLLTDAVAESWQPKRCSFIPLVISVFSAASRTSLLKTSEEGCWEAACKR